MSHIPIATIKSKSENLSKRRLTENQALVRKSNEKVQKAVEATFPAEARSSLQLHFYCECVDGSCKQRLTLSPDTYKKIHRNRRHFIVKPNHESLSVERFIEHHKDYVVVEKLPFSRVRRLLTVRLKTKRSTKTSA